MSIQSPRICAICQTSNPPQAAFCFGCGQPLGQTPATPEVLHQRYHLLHQLGTGGFGDVYQAEDRQLGNRQVAVKEMSTRSNLSTQENAEAEEAFQKEALLLADLLHPNLPRIYDHFRENGRWYLVMDYIEGVTLEKYLAHTPDGYLPLAETFEIGIQLCDVLDYLHTRQPPIIFRDLKPLNIMRTSTGHLYLIDFGIARLFKPGQTKDTVAFGSPGYAAPEQYGKAQTTPRSDIYSLGAVLHQLLTGNDPSLNPFRFAPLRLPARKPTPVALAQLLTRMVEMDETSRPLSMHTVRRELQTIAASIARGTFASIQPAPLPPEPKLSPPPPPPPFLPPQPLPRGGLRVQHITKERSVRTLAWSPDSTRLASACNDNAVDIWDASKGNTRQLYTAHKSSLRAVAWSPDGKWIASAGEDRTVYIWDVSLARPVYIYHKHTHTITGLCWSPDSRNIASCSLDQSIQVWGRESGYTYVNYQRHLDVVYRVAWSPNGKWIASTGYDGKVRIWEAMSGTPVAIYSDNVGQVLALAWSPDNVFLASGGTGGSFQIWEATSGRTLRTYNSKGGQIYSLSWSPDGQQIVAGEASGLARIWDTTSEEDVFAYDGQKRNAPPGQLAAAVYTPAPLEISAVAWSPDGDWIASGDTCGTIHIWAAH